MEYSPFLTVTDPFFYWNVIDELFFLFLFWLSSPNLRMIVLVEFNWNAVYLGKLGAPLSALYHIFLIFQLPSTSKR